MSILVPIGTGLGGLVLGAFGFWLFTRWQAARAVLRSRTYGEGDYQ